MTGIEWGAAGLIIYLLTTAPPTVNIEVSNTESITQPDQQQDQQPDAEPECD